jgi:ribonuclease HI
VRDATVITEKFGFDPATTNNRMELLAVIEGLKLAPADEEIALYTDSNLVVNTLTKWAAGWEKRGWQRREGPVKNLDLVQEAYALSKERPNVRIEWVPGHSGYTWNERADVLSTSHLRVGEAS